MEENLVQTRNIQPIVEGIKPLITSSNKAFVNSRCYKKTKSHWMLINLFFASLSIIIFIIMWFTDLYNDAILQQIVLKNNSDMLSWWLKPPVDPIVRVYIFNYTNIDRFLNGSDAKIKVQEVGPYAYREPVEKINLQFEDDKITFNDNRTHIFDSAYCGENATEEDFVNVPNIPFISAIPNVKRLGFLAEIGFKTILAMSKPQQFQTLNVKKFLFGYRDDFMNLVSKIKWDFTPEDVGILSPRHGVSKFRISVNLGLNNPEKAGKLISVNGITKKDIWKSNECNLIGGSDGALYGPEATRKKKDLPVYLPEICRSLPMKFERKDGIYGIPSSFYTSHYDIFSYPQNSSNYCELKSIMEPHLNGVLDVSDCINGNPPILVSYAHFMEGDSKLFESFEGLHPDRELHTPYAHIHPRLGVPLYGVSKMQLNIKVTKFEKHYEKFNDLILPIAWVETFVEEFSLKYKILLYLSTYVVDIIEVLLKFGSIFGIFISFWYFSTRIFSVNKETFVRWS